MPLPNKSELQKLDIVYLGQPFVQVEAKSLKTTSLDISYLGQPFVTIPSGLNVYANVGGTWTQASSAYVNVSGIWKEINQVSSQISGTWKT